MGTVLLTGSHKSLGESNNPVMLDPAWLEPHRVSYAARPSENAWMMIAAMLQGLVALRGINASVSIGLSTDHLNQPCLNLPGRMWGRLWMESPEIPILHFTHDSRFDNYPFQNLYQWLEDEWPAGVDWEHPDYPAACKLWQEESKWLDFFECRLARKVDALRAEGVESRLQGLRLRALANKIARR